jgi:hypothetical protein
MARAEPPRPDEGLDARGGNRSTRSESAMNRTPTQKVGFVRSCAGPGAHERSLASRSEAA